LNRAFPVLLFQGFGGAGDFGANLKRFTDAFKGKTRAAL
jgi:hypothetical protein